ncbi:MAG: hypothetical protein KDK00_15230 [Rhodobacteraceae bacterium]|nr:hypothetical protein [Paracoccaceae bacterium]
MRLFLFLVMLLPGTAWAEEILSPEEFAAYISDQTLYFAQQGQPYGTEQYLPGRQSIWQYADGTCTRGIWYPRGDMICFVYETDPDEQCWHFLKKGEVFAARAEGREPAADLDVIWRDQRPIPCRGPDVGA